MKRKDVVWAYVKKRNPNYMEDIAIAEVESYEKPVKITARAYYPDGSRWTLDNAEIKREKIPFSNEIVNEFSIPGYDEGVIVQLETRRRCFHPEFIGSFMLRNDHPALFRSISLTYPDDCKLVYGLENPENTDIEQSTIHENGYKKVEFTAYKLSDKWAPWKTEFPEQWYAAVYVSFPPKGKRSYTWQALGEHYLTLSDGIFENSSEIAALADSVKGNSRNEVIENAFSTVVGKIRYHADEEGRFAFFPRKAATIIANGYGDCKEISTLLKAVLRSKKVETHLALISTKNWMQPVGKYPSLDNFNHVILAEGDGTGRYRFLDGTHTWANAENSYYHLIGRTAFVLKPGGSQLARVTAGKDYKNHVVTRSVIKREPASGRWIIEGRIRLTGRPALDFFSQLKWEDTAEKKSLAKEYLQDEFGIYPLAFDFKAPDCNETTFTYKALFQENYISIEKGGFRLASPRLLATSANDSMGLKKGPRLLGSFEQQDSWQFPGRIETGQLEAFQLPFAGCAYSIKGNQLTRTYRQDDKLFAEDDKQLKEWTNKIKATVNATCWR